MSLPKQQTRQRDFSAGELASYTRRADDDELVRAGARTMENWRLMSKGIEQRPGRRLLFVEDGRIDQVRMAPTESFYLCFGAGTLRIRRGDTGAVLYTQTGYAWALATIDQIVWAVLGSEVIITFPEQRPKLLTYLGSNVWIFADYLPESIAEQKRTAFYRIAPRDLTLTPSAAAGTINITFSDSYLVDTPTRSMVGNRLRYQGRQLTIASVINAQLGTAIVNEVLLGGQLLTFGVSVSSKFTVGDKVQGDVSGATGQVVSFPSSTTMIVSLLSDTIFQPVNAADGSGIIGETVIGPTAAIAMSDNPVSTTPPESFNWDEEVMNAYRGWPGSVFVDQNRLGFCDFPAVPGGIAWSVISRSTDLYPGADATEAIFEIAPKKARVYHVAPGFDEFLLTDKGVWYIPISEANPLKPGSVTFREVSSEPASDVAPVSTPEGIVFASVDPERVSTGHKAQQLVAIVATGQTARPYITRAVSDFHAHLFTGIKALAAGGGGGQFQERYVYALNEDGTLAVGRFDAGKQWVGWVPWTAGGGGSVGWVSSLGAGIITATTYTLGATARSFVEVFDADQYMDASVLLNDIPTALAPSGGDGDLWFLAGGTVDLLDGIQPLGSRDVGADGEIVLEEGDELDSETLTIGFTFSPTFIPNIPHAQPGQSSRQSTRRRRVNGWLTVENSSGGFLIGDKRVTTWRQGEDQSIEPPLRTETIVFKPLGRSYDPEIEIVKDVAGPLRIIEMAFEVTI